MGRVGARRRREDTPVGAGGTQLAYAQGRLLGTTPDRQFLEPGSGDPPARRILLLFCLAQNSGPKIGLCKVRLERWSELRSYRSSQSLCGSRILRSEPVVRNDHVRAFAFITVLVYESSNSPHIFRG